MKKKSISPLILLTLTIFLLVLYFSKSNLSVTNIDLSLIKLEKQTSFLYESTIIAIDDIGNAIEDSIRFYSYSLDVLNLTGDNNKLKALNEIKKTAIKGINTSLYMYVVSNLDNRSYPPIIFTSSLISIFSDHIKKIRKDVLGLNKYFVCQYLILPSNLYDSIAFYNESIIMKNPKFICNDDPVKSIESENLFCNITLSMFDPNGDLDRDGILNKDDCDADGDNRTARYNYWTKKFCGGDDLDDNDDGINDKITTKSISLGGKTYILPYSSTCEDFFSINVEESEYYKEINPYYIFLMPFEGIQSSIKDLDTPEEFDYQESSFYVYIAPIRIYIKNILDANNLNEENIYITNIWRSFDVGIYRQTSECDGSPPGC